MASEIEYFDPLHVVDYVVIIVLLLSVIALGLWSSRYAQRSTTGGYFLTGRTMTWWLVGLSLYVSNIGPDNFFGVAGSAAVDGIAVVFYEFSAVTCLFLLGYVFAPVYVSSGAFTTPEYIQKRFGGNRLRLYLAFTQLFLNIFAHTTGELYSGVLLIRLALGWNIYASVIVLFILTAIYTVAGGLTAVMHTDALQGFIMLIGAVILMILSWVTIGSYSTFETQYMEAIPHTTLAGNTTCGVPSQWAWHIFRPADSSMPWPGVLFGIHILSLYYWCCNQVIVQRTLAAKDMTHAKGGTIVGGYLKMTAMFLMVWPGMISRILYTDTVACVDSDVCEERCENPTGCSNVAYPYLILDLMPIVLRGLLLAGMIAGVMSSLTSIFNSASSVFTLDIWKRIRPKASNTEEMIVSRVWILVMAGIGIVWLPFMETSGDGQLLNYMQNVNSHIAPPILAAYLLGMFWERATEPGVFWGLMIGLVLGMTRMILSFVYPGPGCDEPDTRPSFLSEIHFLHFAIILLVASAILIVCISLITKAQPKEELIGMTWWTVGQKAPADQKTDEIEMNEAGVVLAHVALQTDDKDQDADTKCDTKCEEQSTKDENGDAVDKSTTKEAIVVEDTEDEAKYSSTWGCLLYWFCGVTKDGKLSSGDEDEVNIDMTLEENPKWSSFVTVNAVIMLLICFFMWGYFA
ncbi:sodium/mannose cotransporter SLC5A10-like [Ptychodera flava]|uniref:sodium/mannose cotransporter SLC5A10-like n=1 Tax=Ptychodera flava TaxID=63121 RepID=UPI00396A08B2